MVVPIIAGIGLTVGALTIKLTLAALRKFRHLTPQMIAQLNGLKLVDPNAGVKLDKLDPRYDQYQYIRSNYANEGFKPRITEDEALAILGITGNDILQINKKMVHDRWRKLMLLNHPDRQGLQYLSQKLNEAKDVLENSYMCRGK